jgi:hypothetical protein
MFCAVRCVIIICFSLSFSNYSTYVFQYSLYICFRLLSFYFMFCAFCISVLFCVLFLLLYTAVSFPFLYKSTDHCHRVETQIALNKYHLSSYIFCMHATFSASLILLDFIGLKACDKCTRRYKPTCSFLQHPNANVIFLSNIFLSTLF